MNDLKVGLIGTGGIARMHLPAISKIKGVQIAALCDLQEERVKEAASTYGGKTYTDYQKMLAEESLDALFILIPPFAHSGQEEMAVEEGIPFLVEKPVALSLEKAKAIERNVQEKNLITAVGYQLRYMDILEPVKKVLEKDKVALSLGQYFGGVPGGSNSWFVKKDKSGGQVVEQATHVVDLMRHLVGEIRKVDARFFRGAIQKRIPGYDVEDASISLLEFENQTIGSLCCTWLLEGFDSGLKMITTEGVKIEMSPIDRLVLTKGEESEEYKATNDFAYEQDETFLRAVRENNPSLIRADYSEGVKTLAVTFAISESAEKGEPVIISADTEII